MDGATEGEAKITRYMAFINHKEKDLFFCRRCIFNYFFIETNMFLDFLCPAIFSA